MVLAVVVERTSIVLAKAVMGALAATSRLSCPSLKMKH
jgi:hypothetical protein